MNVVTNFFCVYNSLRVTKLVIIINAGKVSAVIEMVYTYEGLTR